MKTCGWWRWRSISGKVHFFSYLPIITRSKYTKLTFIYAEMIKVTISSVYLDPHIFIPERPNTWIGWSAAIFLWQKSRDWTETSRLTWRETKEDLDLFWCADVDASLTLWYTNLGRQAWCQCPRRLMSHMGQLSGALPPAHPHSWELLSFLSKLYS